MTVLIITLDDASSSQYANGKGGDTKHSAPVARQINQVPAVIDQEMVDADRLAYRSTDL